MGIISTIPAKCRDCYRCLRSCPVKAIRIRRGRDTELYAEVVDELCILDGRCVLVCPQQAKRVASGLDRAKQFVQGGESVALSVAPSFVAGLPVDEPQRLISAFRKLGFAIVQETALGAELVAREHLRCLSRTPTERLPLLTSSCPTVVNIIEKHYPELIPYLAPVVSPMVAHARYLKSAYPGIKVVFVGPCFAKKEEAEESGVVDAVLTFAELWQWLQEEDVEISSLPPGMFDPPWPHVARLFPVEGGLLRTASLSTDILARDVLVVSGLNECLELVRRLAAPLPLVAPPRIAELLACRGGCVNGPGVVAGIDPFYRRKRTLIYGEQGRKSELDDLPEIDLGRKYANKKIELPCPDEAAVANILGQVGKFSAQDELNCGACGYSSCRDKAVAVFRGFADVEMCIPFMRDRAESISNVLFQASPVGLIIVDQNLNVVEMNRAAQEMFACMGRKVKGLSLSSVMDPTHFKQVLDDKTFLKTSVRYEQYDLTTEQVIFYLDRHRVAVGIITDVSDDCRMQEEMRKLKEQTVQRAQEVINKQMKVAQEIAGLLGETTAETKVLLSRLIQLMQQD